MCDEVSATEWHQLGFHWERATNWSSAMTCYYQSGMLLREQGDPVGCKAHFTEAFRMLEKMRQEAAIPVLGTMSAALLSSPRERGHFAETETDTDYSGWSEAFDANSNSLELSGD